MRYNLRMVGEFSSRSSWTTYTHDHENRVRTEIDPGRAQATLAYWAGKMRRYMQVGGTRTTFVWAGSVYLQSRRPSGVTMLTTADARIMDTSYGESGCAASIAAGPHACTRCPQTSLPIISAILQPIREAFADNLLQCYG